METNNIDVDFEQVNPSEKGIYSMLNDEKVMFIVMVVEKHTGVKLETFKLPTRKRLIITPRQICMYFLKLHTDYSLDRIGQIFGKDHGTVIHSRKQIDDLIETDKEIRNICKKIKEDVLKFVKPNSESKFLVFKQLLNIYTDDDFKINKWLKRYISAEK